ncbi:MAG: cell division protein ZapB [Spirochaetales bacterium]|nr:MAG: cell division protein ZapB [Spirochaetales bacterium]
MLTLEQVKVLESRVEKAVALIESLRSENATLRSGLAVADGRVSELEELVRDFQKDQVRIEEGIIEALRKLDAFEDLVHGAADPVATVDGQQAETSVAVKSSPVGVDEMEGDPSDTAVDGFQETGSEASADLDIF